MKPPRGLSEDEAAAWARLAATVVPLNPPLLREEDRAKRSERAVTAKPKREVTLPEPASPPPTRSTSRGPANNAAVGSASALPDDRSSRSGEDRNGLDSHWERRLRAGTVSPDFTLDLHEHTLDAAYQRLLGGLDMARETGARMVLVIAGRERPVPAADRSGQRGAIRAKLLDWLASSRHAGAIASIRKAHRRHGGDGALYVIIKKTR